MVQPGLSGNPFFLWLEWLWKKRLGAEDGKAAQKKLNVFACVKIIIFNNGVYEFTFGERYVVSIEF